jgi:hypothetical protein
MARSLTFTHAWLLAPDAPTKFGRHDPQVLATEEQWYRPKAVQLAGAPPQLTMFMATAVVEITCFRLSVSRPALESPLDTTLPMKEIFNF